MFELRVREVADTFVVSPAGELDLSTARELGDALAGVADRGATRVVLDLRGLTFVDSSGVGLIVKFQRYYAAEGIAFGLVRGDDLVQRTFELSRVEPLLPWVSAP
jgi:anti-anti-sigma factor